MSRRHDPTKLGMNKLKEEDAQLAWKASIGGYELRDADGQTVAELSSSGSEWSMLVLADGKRYVGKRESLELAFKAIADMLYKVRKSVWLRMSCQEVMAPWQSDLTEVK
jgi:hypothetical protein